MAAIPNRSSCCFIDDDDINDVAYITKLNRTSIISLRRSISIMSSSSGYASSPKRHYDVRFDLHRLPHFLESCFHCRKSIAGDSDIFMYRGDAPFCSEECRLEQIEMDEARERRRNVSMKSGLQADPNSNNTQGYTCRTVRASV